MAKQTVIAMVLALATGVAAASVCHDPAPAHACLRSGDARAACGEFLKADPYDVDIRLSLCQAHVANGESLRALIVLDKGLQFCGSDANRCQRLQRAVAAVEKNSTVQLGSSQMRAQQGDQRLACLSRARSPVNTAIVACEEALIAFPKEAALHGAFGEKLLRGKQPARAVLAFRRALELQPGDPNFLSWHDRAETDRQYLAQRCFLQSEVERCNRAVLPGTTDEARLHLYRSKLFLQGGNTMAAREAMLIAQLLRPDDQDLSQELLKLLPREAEIGDSDLYLPRGRARLASGDLDRAIADLRYALEVRADREQALRELTRARDMRAEIVQEQCFNSIDIEQCERLILAGEPDEQNIRAHITTIREAQRRIEGQSLQPSVPLPVTPTIKKTPTIVAQPAPAKTTPTPPKPVVMAVGIRNNVSVNGVTH